MLACRPFRKFRKVSKCSGEVNKTKLSQKLYSFANLMNDCVLSFAINQERQVNNILKTLVASDSIVYLRKQGDL